MVKVVELKVRKPDTTVEAIARFLLTDEGTVEVVGLAPRGKETAEHLTEHGIPGPADKMLQRDDGVEFLAHLCEAFRGSRLWATPVFEMDTTTAPNTYKRQTEL